MRKAAILLIASVGVVASIATSGYDTVTRTTSRYSVEVSEIGEGAGGAVRFCPIWGFGAYSPEAIGRAELSVSLEDGGDTVVPVTLSLDDGRHVAIGAIGPDRRSLELEIEASPDEVRSWGDECSPWARVVFGPAEQGSGGVLEWRMSLIVSVDTAGIAWPWEEKYGHLETVTE